MPTREWRKCETCEWSGEPVTGDVSEGKVVCFHIKSIWPGFDDSEAPSHGIISKNGWCSEWKSAEPETCGMCEWFFPFGDGAEKGMCNHSTAQPRNYSSRSGACEYFRREDAD